MLGFFRILSQYLFIFSGKKVNGVINEYPGIFGDDESARLETVSEHYHL